MKIRLSTCWVSMRNFDNSSATLEIEGVGEQHIHYPLPQHIKDQIEKFYVRLCQERMEKAMGEDRVLSIRPHNPKGAA